MSSRAEFAITIYDQVIEDLDNKIRSVLRLNPKVSDASVVLLDTWQDGFCRWFISEFNDLYGDSFELDKRLREASYQLIPDDILFSHPKFIALRDKALASGNEFWEAENEEIARNRAIDLVTELSLYVDISQENKDSLITKVAAAIKQGIY